MSEPAPVAWGVDYGVRSFYAARVDMESGRHEAHSHVCPKGLTRYEELGYLSTMLAQLVDGEPVFIEEPVVAGSRNLRTALLLAQTAGALLSRLSYHAELVPVSLWKKTTVGAGNASKEDVALWLADKRPEWHDNCAGDQNRVDATCIALCGASILATT